MKVIIPGGSGHCGTLLARAFHEEGHEVVVLSRRVTTTPWKVVEWDGKTPGDWTRDLDGADVVINLAGRSVNCRYGMKNRREIRASRIDSTRIVGEAIAKAEQPPRVWLQASTATLYEHRFDAPNDDVTGILDIDNPNAPDTWRFSVDVALNWERAAFEANAWPRTRLVLLRTAIVMSADRGGAFDVLLRLVRYGLGGQNGDGRQFVSWIHEADFVRAVKWLIEDETMSGPVVLGAPHPLPNCDFMRALRTAWGVGFGMPATKWMLEIGAFLLGTETELILKSRYVVPTRLLKQGFQFQFADWPDAARDLCEQWRRTP